MQALSDLLLNCFKWHLLSNEAASLTVLSGIYCQMRERLLSPSSALKSLSQTARNVPSETETQKDPDCLTVQAEQLGRVK